MNRHTEVDVLCESLLSEYTDKSFFVERVSALVTSTLDYILDGEESLSELEACEKSIFGVKFEKRFVRAFDLPRKISKSRNPHDLKLDTRIAGIDVDIKCTLGHNWMIPREAVGHWCILVQVDDASKSFSLGLFKALEENLTRGCNQDKKRSVSAAGRDTVLWIVENAPFSRQ